MVDFGPGVGPYPELVGTRFELRGIEGPLVSAGRNQVHRLPVAPVDAEDDGIGSVLGKDHGPDRGLGPAAGHRIGVRVVSAQQGIHRGAD